MKPTSHASIHIHRRTLTKHSWHLFQPSGKPQPLNPEDKVELLFFQPGRTPDLQIEVEVEDLGDAETPAFVIAKIGNGESDITPGDYQWRLDVLDSQHDQARRPAHQGIARVSSGPKLE